MAFLSATSGWSNTCLDPLAMAANLNGLRESAAETANYERVVAEKYLTDGKLFRDPTMLKIFEKAREDHSRFVIAQTAPKRGISTVGDLEAYFKSDEHQSSQDHRYPQLARFIATMHSFFAQVPQIKVIPYRDTSRGYYEIGNSTYEIEKVPDSSIIYFLYELKQRFPASVLPTGISGEEALQQLATVNSTINEYGISLEEYYRLAPEVNRFFAELEAAGPHRNERKIAALGLLPNFLSLATEVQNTREKYQKTAARRDALLEEFEKTEAGYTFLTRPRFTKRKDRKSTDLSNSEYYAEEAQKKLNVAEEKFKDLFARILPVEPSRAIVLPNPLAVAAEEKLTALLPADHTGLVSRLETARREVAQLEVIKERFFSDSGLFGLAKINTKNNQLSTPEQVIDQIHEVLTPPNFESDADGALAAEAKLNQWRRFFADLGVSEADYLRLVGDLNEMDRDPALRHRLVEYLIPDWRTGFKSLEGMKSVAFTKVGNPLTGSAPTARVPAPPTELLTSPSVRSSVGFYLDTSASWTQRLDGLAHEVMHTSLEKLHGVTGGVAGEVRKAAHKGRSLPVRDVTNKLTPALVDFVKQLDAKLGELADHHDEGLLIQHSIAHQLSQHRDLASAKRTVVVADAEKLPEWQQELAIKHVERDFQRISTLEKVKLGFDQSVDRLTTVEATAERLRDLAITLQLWLSSHHGAHIPKERLVELAEQLEALPLPR